MPEQSYHQFCPVAMASELLCTRWTIVLLRELLAGSTRFNELRRGLPRISPALLAQRLRALEEAGIVVRRRVPGEPEIWDYHLSEAGRDLEPLVVGFGRWGQRWVPSRLSLDKLDATLLMWDMRRNLRPDPRPPARRLIQFRFDGAAPRDARWWLIVEPDGAVDLCSVDPGHDVDLYVRADLRAMTAVWMGIEPIAAPLEDGRILLTGAPDLACAFPAWLKLSPFAAEPRKVA